MVSLDRPWYNIRRWLEGGSWRGNREWEEGEMEGREFIKGERRRSVGRGVRKWRRGKGMVRYKGRCRGGGGQLKKYNGNYLLDAS